MSLLAEMLTFLGDRPDGQDTDLLAASLRRLVDTTGHALAELQPTSTAQRTRTRTAITSTQQA
ncbi:MAG: hypothetical protein ACRDRI_06195 [Pseudonocardiaceae bacterium]